MKKSIRGTAKAWHVWSGLSLGLLFCLMGLSSSILVYRDAIETALRPRWTAVSGARPASVLEEADANIQRRWPDGVRTRVTFPRGAGEPYQYQIRVDGKLVHLYFDATTGEILGAWELPWLDGIAGFHQNLLLPPAGRQLVGFIRIALFLSSLSGLLIWLFRNPTWKGILRIGWRSAFKKSSWSRFSFDLHRSTGLVANAFLLILSFTGICLGFPDAFRSFAEAVTATLGARSARITVVPVAMQQPIDLYVRASLEAIPGGVIRELRFPQAANSPATARIWLPGDYRDEGGNRVSLDPATARIVGVDAAVNWSPASKLASIPAPIHSAEWGGPIVKVLWCLTGLTPSILFESGFVFWWKGWRARRKVAVAAPANASRVLAHR
jgi:uncharacterized iron-regulated membrane protein